LLRGLPGALAGFGDDQFGFAVRGNEEGLSRQEGLRQSGRVKKFSIVSVFMG